MNRLPPDLPPRKEPAREPVPKFPAQCWSCFCLIENECQGHSLNGTKELHVCLECWEDIPAAQRILLQQRMRQDLTSLAELGTTLLDAFIREYRQRGALDLGQGDS